MKIPTQPVPISRMHFYFVSADISRAQKIGDEEDKRRQGSKTVNEMMYQSLEDVHTMRIPISMISSSMNNNRRGSSVSTITISEEDFDISWSSIQHQYRHHIMQSSETVDEEDEDVSIPSTHRRRDLVSGESKISSDSSLSTRRERRSQDRFASGSSNPGSPRWARRGLQMPTRKRSNGLNDPFEQRRDEMNNKAPSGGILPPMMPKRQTSVNTSFLDS